MGKPFSRQEPCPGSGLPAVHQIPCVRCRRSRCPECDRNIQVHANGTIYDHVRVYTINYPKVRLIDGTGGGE